MRPRHWVKNALVAAPLLFSGRYVETKAWGLCLLAMAAFCLLSSGIYLINDLCDRRQDAVHPVKRRRAIASGRLSISRAIVAAMALILLAGGLLAIVETLKHDPEQLLGGWGLSLWAGLYVVLNLLYSFWLRNHAIIDVLAIAMGFVLRAMAGAAAINVPISPWLVLCTLTLCLFIALAKRRSEIAEMDNGSTADARSSHGGYRKQTLEHMMGVSAALAIVTYCLYCLAPRTISHIGSGHMIWTIPLVIYATFRYYRTTCLAACSDAVELLVRDKIMWLLMAMYVILAGLIIQYGSHPAIRGLLDITELKR